MSNFVTLGKVVEVESQAEAQELFLNRRKTGISGVVFTPEIIIPKWTATEKIRLSEAFHFCEVSPEEDDDYRYDHIADWKNLNQNFTRDLFKLARDFNKTSNPRSLRFALNGKLDFKLHADSGAIDGWLHLHLDGAGMVYANPLGDEPVKLRLASPHGNDNLDTDEFNQLILDHRKVELKSLKPHQAMAFDHRMAHRSAAVTADVSNFRIPTFD